MRTVTKTLQVLMVSLLLAFAFQSNAQVTLFTEGWETAAIGQTPPTGWAVDLVSGSNYTYFASSGSFPTCSPYEGTRFVEFRSWYAGSGTTNRLKMTTPISTVGYGNITVDFAWLVDPGYSGASTEGVTVQWSTNGTTWTNSTFFLRYAPTQQWLIKSVTLPAGAANQATLYVAFSFYSNYGNNCHMDIMHVKGSQTGNLTGTVRNCYNNAVMPGVSVSCGGVGPVLTNGSGVYTLNGVNAGSQTITATFAGFTNYSASVNVVPNTTTTYNFCMNPIPGVLSGVVTNCANGNPVVGVKVSFGTQFTYSVAGGLYSLNVYPGGTQNVQASKEGWELFTQNAVTVTPPATTTLNFCINEAATPPSSPFTAALNAGQTAVDLNWGLPVNDMVLIYDDGIQDNFAIWATGGEDNLNAMKFTPISYPTIVKGFYVNIGQASNYPSGSNAFSPVKMTLYNEVGGLPGTEYPGASTTITPTVYGWTKANFATTVTIPSGNFFIVMVQIGNSSASPGIAIDTTVQQMRSYSKFGPTPWIPGPGNFMMRAIVNGSGGPLMLGDQSGTPITASAVPGLNYQYAPATVTGYEGSPKGYSDMGLGPDVLLGYQVWRLLQTQEGTPALWTSVGTPTGTSLTDNSWPSLPCGPYRWAVEAQYTFNRWSTAIFSNALGKCWTCNVIVNVDMSCDSTTAAGAIVTFHNLDVVDTVYTYLMDATGTHTFTNFWKGNYNLTVTKFGYTNYVQTPIAIMGDMTINVMLLQIKSPPTGLTVPDSTLHATWFPPVYQVMLLNETFSSGSFATNQWVVDGGPNTWYISSGNGNPGQCAEFQWSPEVTDYSRAFTSKLLTGVYAPVMTLKYDIHLNNYGNTTLEQLAVELWDGTVWHPLKNYDNSTGSDIPYTTETVDITAYANIAFKIRFRAYGQDSYNIDWWDVDNISVLASTPPVNPNPCVIGYNFYLNNILDGFTPDTFYDIPPSHVVYGTFYHACVLAIYGSGYSTNSCYDFTSHFLCPPNTLAGVPIECNAYLTWEKPNCGGCTLATYQYDSGTYGNALSINPGYAIQDGNYFPVTPPTTTGIIKSFDIWFSQYSSWTTQSCVLYVYNAAYALIGQSAPFMNGPAATWPSGTWINIPMPDVPYSGPFYAMVDYTTSTVPKNGMGLDVVTPQVLPSGLAYSYYQGVFTPATIQYGLPAPETFAERANVCVDGKKDGPITVLDPAKMAADGKNSTPIPSAAVNCGANLDASVVQLNNPPSPSAPSAITLLGYRVFRNNAYIATIADPNTLEYYDYNLNPGTYQYKVDAYYNVNPFNPPTYIDNSQPAGPVSITTACGYPLPFFEPWDGGSFGYQQWTFAPSQGNWVFNTAFGNPTPCADFQWDPIVTNYELSLVSPTIDATPWTCADIFCDVDIKLIDRNATGNEKLDIDVLVNGNWINKAEITNTGSVDWTMHHIDITSVKGKGFKVRFRANGESSGDILHWYVDNIHIYGVCKAPQTLAGQQNQFTTTLTWVAPVCGGGGPNPQWIHWDSGDNSTSIGYNAAYDFGIAARWTPTQIAPLDGGSVSKISFWPASAGAATWRARIWEGANAANMVVDVPIPPASIVNDQWNIFTLPTPHPIDVSQELWVGLDVNASGGWPAGCDAGPAVVGFGDMFNDGTGWVPMSQPPNNLDYNWNIQAYVEPSKKDAGTSSVILTQTPVNNPKGMSASTSGKINTGTNTSFNSGTGLILPKGPMGSQLMGYNVWRTPDNATTPFSIINPSIVTGLTYLDVHPSTTEPTTTWKYYVTAVFHDTLDVNPNSILCEPSSDTITIMFPAVGINDLTNSSISMYPNPANDVVNIVSTNDIKTVEVLNYIGQMIYTNKNVDQKTVKLNVTGFKSGVYFVKVTTTSGIKTTKITVTH